MNENKIRELIWNLKKVRGSVLHFSKKKKKKKKRERENDHQEWTLASKCLIPKAIVGPTNT